MSALYQTRWAELKKAVVICLLPSYSLRIDSHHMCGLYIDCMKLHIGPSPTGPSNHNNIKQIKQLDIRVVLTACYLPGPEYGY